MMQRDRRPALAVSLRVNGRATLVVGDGPGARERTSRLREAGATTQLVSPVDYQTGMCAGAFLVVAHTDDPALDRRIAADAHAAGALAYAHDQPDASDLVFPALARRGPLSLAITTDGVAPALARRVREEIARLLDEMGPALDLLLDELERERASRAPGSERAEHLYRLACRLSFAGRLAIARAAR
ncbi:MAG TPA: NAD(P)-dependent oxidoreductase [Kofleriaceae bacterium]|nr:NAD(P)-dependent oxidoreductase [Kofleriaceae bacterium]